MSNKDNNRVLTRPGARKLSQEELDGSVRRPDSNTFKHAGNRHVQPSRPKL
jgi:hypothetical protein